MNSDQIRRIFIDFRIFHFFLGFSCKVWQFFKFVKIFGLKNFSYKMLQNISAAF
jgi:hypothetical protein